MQRSNTGLDENGKPKEANLPLPVRVFQSQFNHVFIVVTPWRFDARGKTTHYKVVVACKDGVRPHRPYLPKVSNHLSFWMCGLHRCVKLTLICRHRTAS